MPHVTTWLLRAAFLQFLAGSVLGSMMLAAKGGLAGSVTPAWVFPVHIELMIYGWLLQLVLGVALWILPRRPGQPRDHGAWAGWVGLTAINAAVLLAACGAALNRPWLVALGRAAALAGAATIAISLVPRIRAYRITVSSPPAPPT